GGGGQKPLNNQSLENPKNAKGLDSKSKLESKNPNKIQTTKIQDSKIQLESNPKDLAKLESNSPKLKDSKVSKTSKDSMKLESSPKLDSKTCQKSNSKSKSPKIQRAKTCDSKQSKKLTKSKNSSKLKSFIRTIPISIALASALSSQAVANWNTDGGACSGNTYNCTITKDVELNSIKGSTQIIATGNTGTLTIESGYTVERKGEGAVGNNGMFSIEGVTEGFTNKGIITSLGMGRWRNIIVGKNANLGYLVNSGTIISSNISILLYGVVGSILNTGTITTNGNSGFMSAFAIEGQTGADLIFEDQSLTQSTGNFKNIIWTQGGSSVSATSLGEIVAKDSSRLEGNFDFNNKFTGESITFQNSANMTGNISLEGNARITNGIAIRDSGTIAGNISLVETSAIANGITIGGNSTGGSGNNASLTGNISLNDSSRISKILIDGSNMGGSGTNGTPKLDGDITLNTSNEITNGITIANGGTYDGTIHNKNSSSIGGVVVDNGTIVGDIIASGTSRLNGITIVNGGEMRGNIEARWVNGSNGHTMNLGNIDIQSRLQGGITLANAATIESLSLSNGGTITNAVSIGAGGSDGHTSILKTITLNGASGINSLVVGSSSDNAGTINSITLGGDSSIGSINVA
ncbi:hypothetical protein, partial [Helicobacter pullorum]|uniref:hypothetical protein n=1 Tax=Helicobacter pullorum TaxID=35818 RepID=UPI000A9D4033